MFKQIVNMINQGLFIFLILLLSCQKHEPKAIISPSVVEGIDIEFTKINNESNFNSIYFINDDIGFVAGFEGVIYKSIDGGSNWNSLDSKISMTLYDIYFLNLLEGFVVGGNSSCEEPDCVPNGAIILFTDDGGLTWNNSFITQKRIAIRSIDFINDNLGFAVGDNVILKTIDKGITWEINEIGDLIGIMTDVSFANENFGLITRLFDNILITTDGGINWQTITTTNGIGYYSISSVDENHLFISSQRKIYNSNDIGHSWNELVNSPSDIFDIYFTGKTTSFAFGRGNYSGGDFGYRYGSIYYTKDSGKTWIGNSNIRETTIINSSSFPSRNLGYAVSRNTVIKIRFTNP